MAADGKTLFLKVSRFEVFKGGLGGDEDVLKGHEAKGRFSFLFVFFFSSFCFWGENGIGHTLGIKLFTGLYLFYSI